MKMRQLDLEQRPTRRNRAKNTRKPLIEERLLDAMEKMLEEGNSLGQITIDDLASRADIARSTFYTHFKDKGELVARLMGVVTKDIIDGAGLWFKNSEKANPEDLHEGIKGIVYAFKKHQAIVAAIQDLAPHDDNVRRLYEEMMTTLCHKSELAVHAVHQQGKAKKQATAEVAKILTWINALYLTNFVSKCESKDLDSLAEALGHITVSAIFNGN
jgi:AcrR family transcriptional regulator